MSVIHNISVAYLQVPRLPTTCVLADKANTKTNKMNAEKSAIDDVPSTFAECTSHNAECRE